MIDSLRHSWQFVPYLWHIILYLRDVSWRRYDRASSDNIITEQSAIYVSSVGRLLAAYPIRHHNYGSTWYRASHWFSLAPAILMTENTNPFSAMGKSWKLAYANWRVALPMILI